MWIIILMDLMLSRLGKFCKWNENPIEYSKKYNKQLERRKSMIGPEKSNKQKEIDYSNILQKNEQTNKDLKANSIVINSPIPKSKKIDVEKLTLSSSFKSTSRVPLLLSCVSLNTTNRNHP